jgi:hypothetical protein
MRLYARLVLWLIRPALDLRSASTLTITNRSEGAVVDVINNRAGQLASINKRFGSDKSGLIV